MTRPTQGTGGPDGRPRCYNGYGQPDHANFLVQDGWEPGITPQGTPTQYPRMVEVPNHFSRECASWRSHPGTDPVPLAEAWRCEGCRLLPRAIVSEALNAAAKRWGRK